MNFIFEWHGHKLRDFNQRWLSPQQLQEYADAIHQNGASIDFCWGFVDRTVQPICRPGREQRMLYNGHKRVHLIKFRQHPFNLNGRPLCIYGDSAYPIRPQLMGPFRGATITPDQYEFNQAMSKVILRS